MQRSIISILAIIAAIIIVPTVSIVSIENIANNGNQTNAQPAPTNITVSNQNYTNASDTAKRDIFTALGNAVENHYEKVTGVYINITDSDTGMLLIYNKTGINLPPPPADNKPPVLAVNTPVNCEFGKACELSIIEVRDPEGNSTTVLWKQQDQNPAVALDNTNGSNVSFNASLAGTFVFNVTAFDNIGASTSKLITANVADIPPQTNCGENEVWDGNSCECKAGFHQDNTEACVPNDPTPVPTGPIFELIFVGDLKGNVVFDSVKKDGFDLVVANGDLTYVKDLKPYKSTFGTFGDKQRCNIGNHDAKEDGSSSIEVEALQYCKAHWYEKIANGKAIVIGFTTNGNTNTEAAYVNSILGNNTIMDGVKTAFLTSHKNAHVPPNAHHPAEAAALYEKIIVPSGVERIEVNAHNHIKAMAPSKGWYIEGAGGKSHYDCGTDQVWVFCNNKVYGYLKFEINTENGAFKANFYDTSGKILQ